MHNDARTKVQKVFDAIPLDKREWVVDEGKWRHYRLFYNEKDDSIDLEITNRYGDWVDCFDVTDDYLEKGEM